MDNKNTHITNTNINTNTNTNTKTNTNINTNTNMNMNMNISFRAYVDIVTILLIRGLIRELRTISCVYIFIIRKNTGH